MLTASGRDGRHSFITSIRGRLEQLKGESQTGEALGRLYSGKGSQSDEQNALGSQGSRELKRLPAWSSNGVSQKGQ